MEVSEFMKAIRQWFFAILYSCILPAASCLLDHWGIDGHIAAATTSTPPDICVSSIGRLAYLDVCFCTSIVCEVGSSMSLGKVFADGVCTGYEFDASIVHCRNAS